MEYALQITIADQGKRDCDDLRYFEEILVKTRIPMTGFRKKPTEQQYAMERPIAFDPRPASQMMHQRIHLQDCEVV